MQEGDRPWKFGQGEDSTSTHTAIGRRNRSRSSAGPSDQKISGRLKRRRSRQGQGDLQGDRGSSYTPHKYNRDRAKVSARSPPPSHTQPTIDITSRTPGREQPALPTGTQGERRSLLHGNGVPPPIVGRLGASECRVGSRESCDRPSTTGTDRSNCQKTQDVGTATRRCGPRPGKQMGLMEKWK